MSDGASPVARSAARVVVVDPDDRVLLLHCVDEERGVSWWDTPGGGLWEGESYAQAAQRELGEETGLVEVDLGPWVWTHHDAFVVRGTLFHQDERFFLVRCRPFLIDGAGLEPDEQAVIRAFRWWSLEDLEATSEELSPHGLAALVGSLLREGPPSTPVEVWSTTRAHCRVRPAQVGPLLVD